MKKEKRVSSQLRILLWLAIAVSVLAALAGILVRAKYPVFGYGIIFGAILCLIAMIFYTESLEKQISAEIVSAGIEQGQIRKDIIMEMPLPYVLTSEEGDVIWTSPEFEEYFGRKITKRNISQMFPEIYKKIFPQRGSTRNYDVAFDDKDYRVEARYIRTAADSSVADSAGPVEDGGEPDEYLLAFYFFDETSLRRHQEEKRRKSLAAGLIYIDNYEEVLEGMEEVRQSLLLALVERKVVKYMQELDAIIKKFEKDKFLFVVEEQNLEKLISSRFSILDEVRTISIGNELAMTLSISVGVHEDSYTDTYESARIAMDMALGRGGDQAVVRDGETISYFGGKTQKVEKSTRVKARVKAHALREFMLTHDKIFIMGHRNPDADCVGAALGIYCMAQTLNREGCIIMDKSWPAIEPIVTELMKETEPEEKVFYTGEEAMDMNKSDAMLVIVDVNIPSMTECPELLRQVRTIVVLDHHRQTSDTIKNAVLSYVEPYASSTCEMVAEVLQYVSDKPKLRTVEADALYSGILVDTDNFVIKAGVRTFEAAAYLRRAGADVTRVRKMFREDFDHVKIQTSIVNQAEIFMDEFAISTQYGKNVPGATVVGAKAANSLLSIRGIRASFVLTALDEGIYISARSIDDVNVQIIMERFGGGGHLTMAAAQIKDMSIPEAVQLLKNTIKEMKQEGDI
ncbi:MAG: DHH family phosphoesterase [Eubacterium sp.]|nr:DHH family phosphoesterase [Eubacterium sp.]